MISKVQFVNAINFISTQNDKQNKFCSVLEELSPNCYVDCFLYSEYETAYLQMIKLALGLSEEQDILEWWLYDCDYGKHAELTSVDGVEFVLNSPELLYDYIITEELK